MDKIVKNNMAKLLTDFPYYAPNVLKIRLKKAVKINGRFEKVAAFTLNKSQLYIHEKLEKQKREFGYIRALILKGRQQGTSTYTEGRFFQKTTTKFGVKTYILAHEAKATANIFRMAKRFYDNMPPELQPQRAKNNSFELYFDKLDSAYGVGTANSGDGGRSDTIDYFHGSEVAFWENTDDLKTGVFQAAEAAKEIILESTANGFGNMFQRMWKAAEAGEGKFIAIFVPWYWQDEYKDPTPDDFELTDEEREYLSFYEFDGMTIEHIVWRRNKIIEFENDGNLFKQEYPATAAEAFQTTGGDSFISAESVMRSRRANVFNPLGPYLVGCDPSREGKDATTFIRRKGRKAFDLDAFFGLDDMEKAGRAKSILDNEPVDMMFIDRGGGSGMYDRLVEMGYGDRVRLINFGSKALDPDRFPNRRTEMWDSVKEWLDSDLITDLPDNDPLLLKGKKEANSQGDYLQGDLVAPGFKYTSNNQKIIESKDEIKKRLGKSPDAGDALALTFAEPVFYEETVGRGRQKAADDDHDYF